MTTPPVRAAIYTRISKDVSQLGAGVRRQEAECRKLIGDKSWSLVGVFTDNDTSAYSGAARPGYQALLAAIRAGQVDTVVVWHTDRLYRRAADLEAYIQVCEAGKVSTHAVQSGPLDLATPSGRMVARQLGAVAAYEVEQKSARQLAANQARAATGGVRKGGTRLFGYLRDMTGIVEAEADLVRQAYQDLVGSDTSMYAIAKKWNELGITTPQGRRRLPADVQAAYDQALARWQEELEAALDARQEPPERPKRPYEPSGWDGTKVRLLLQNPRYAGITTYRRQIVRNDAGEPVMGQWTPLVDLATWQAAQAIIASKPRWPGGERQLLAGVAVCGICGERMAGGGTRNGRRRIRCAAHGGHPYREAAPIEEFVTSVILRRLQESDAREVLAGARQAPDVDVAGITATLADLAAREQGIATAYAEGTVSLEQLTTATERIRAQRASLEQQLPAPASPVLAELLDAEDIRQVWDGLDQDRQRMVIGMLATVEILPAGTKEKAYLDWRNRVLNPESVKLTWLS